MSGPLGSQQWMYSTGFYPYEIDQSLRFNEGDFPYLQRTPASAGNRRTYTYSVWAKRGTSTDYPSLFNSRVGSTAPWTLFHFHNTDEVRFNTSVDGTTQYPILTDAKFRDHSAWYHIVYAVDTTQATASNRVKIYVNGVLQTVTGTYPPQNFDTAMNLTQTHQIGANLGAGSNQNFDGYLAEVNFIDGQALDATSFGEFKSGVWIPKSYSGSYGTNGFYLDFGNSGSLGADSSGNGNNWTPNNLAATDQVIDSPTNNFATFSPLVKSGNTFSEGNLKVTCSASTPAKIVSTIGASSGKWYAEYLYLGSSSYPVGIAADSRERDYLGMSDGNTSISFWPSTSQTQLYINGTSTSWAGSTTTWANGDIIGLALNADNEEISIYKNGSLISPVVSYSAYNWNQAFFAGGNYVSSLVYTTNFGQDSSFAGNKTAQGNTDARGIGDFYYAPPAGYLALCTANLPDPAIDPAQDDVPADYFNTVLWTSESPYGDILITGVGFQPDLVWAKSRTDPYNHVLTDSVRGVGKTLYSDLTSAETTNSAYGYLGSFDTDGFTGTSGSTDNSYFNYASGDAYVAWNWLAGNGTSSNTDGTITSTVSANQKAGFSVVTFTTDGTNTNVGTGLSSSAPLDMVVIKRRDSTSEWQVGHRFSGQGVNFAYHLELNSTAALSGSGPYFMGSQATSNGDRIYLASGTYGVSSATWVAYCFQSVEGYSKFGSYTGNGSTDGPFVYTGFRPAFVMAKNTDAASQWIMFDAERDIDNPTQARLRANASNTEAAQTVFDFLSNGFKLRATGTDLNDSGNNYIYMAFAEMPFKYSNAR